MGNGKGDVGSVTRRGELIFARGKTGHVKRKEAPVGEN